MRKTMPATALVRPDTSPPQPRAQRQTPSASSGLTEGLLFTRPIDRPVCANQAAPRPPRNHSYLAGTGSRQQHPHYSNYARRATEAYLRAEADREAQRKRAVLLRGAMPAPEEARRRPPRRRAVPSSGRAGYRCRGRDPSGSRTGRRGHWHGRQPHRRDRGGPSRRPPDTNRRHFERVPGLALGRMSRTEGD